MKKIMRSPVVTGIMFVLAAALLLVGSIGGTQAALQVRSNDYLSGITLRHIGVTLLENGTPVAYRNYGAEAASGFTQVQGGNLVLNSLGDDKDFKIGKQYPFVITARNSGTIPQYVRVVIHKYWKQGVTPSGAKGWVHGDNGTKIMDVIYDPGYIQLGFGGTPDTYNTASWIKETEPAPPNDIVERDVYYYRGILNPGETTDALVDSLSISKLISKDCVVTTEGNKTIYTYAYDGYAFVVEAEVDAVQTHSKEAAITSAWGNNSSIISQLPDPAA